MSCVLQKNDMLQFMSFDSHKMLNAVMTKFFYIQIKYSW